jgi:lipoprotein-releasing system permease protein
MRQWSSEKLRKNAVNDGIRPFNALQVERNVMFLILTIIVIVAAFDITSGLIMLVKDKGRDIGILRTMGVTQGAIKRVFMMTGASIGVVGTFVGFLLALLVCLNIESIQRFVSWLTIPSCSHPSVGEAKIRAK